MYKILITILAVSFSTNLYASWELRSQYVKLGERSVTQLNFKNKKGKSFEYKPSEIPLGMVDSESKIINKEQIFITYWSNGASTMIKVFAPESSKSPICELISYNDEKVEARVKDKKLQLKIIKQLSGDWSWESCGT